MMPESVHRVKPATARLAAIACVALPAALMPLLVPGRLVEVRFVVALVATIVLMKCWDLAYDAWRGRSQPRYLAQFLINPGFLVARREGAERQPSRAANVRELWSSLVGATLALSAFLLSTLIDWSKLPFILQHSIKVTALFIGGVNFFHVLAATVRLLGGYSQDPGEAPLWARTPAEFWRRYNRIVGEFLRCDVFMPFDGRRHPARAMFLAFAVSGLFHEYLLSMAIGRIEGLQLAYFLVQGAAVVLTSRLNPTGGAAVVGSVATLAFNLVSSMLFFASANNVVKIYQ